MKIVIGIVLAVIGLLVALTRKKPAMVAALVMLSLGGYLLFTGIRAWRVSKVMEAFIAAAGSGDLATVQRMAREQPLFINSIQRRDAAIVNRPLHAAAKGLHPEVVEFLLENGAMVDADLEDGSTALHAAGENGSHGESYSLRREAVVRALLAHGASVNVKDDLERTPLMAHAEDARAVALLLQHGADVKAKDYYGHTALHYAVMVHGDHTGSITQLLDHGAEIDPRDRHNKTPLLAAAGNVKDMAMLLARGADPKAHDDQGRTALHLAAQSPQNLRSDLDVLALLCACGLDPGDHDNSGSTPLGIAREGLQKESSRIWVEGRRSIVRFLDAGGPCRRLAGATEEQRKFAVAEFRCADHDNDACGSLAWDYDEGKGVAANPVRAAMLYEPLCDAGETFACNNLGIMFEEGRGVAKSEAKAQALFRRACDGGDKDGCDNLQSNASSAAATSSTDGRSR